MEGIVPASSAPVFRWHESVPISGSLLSDYDISEVIDVSVEPNNQLRTLVLAAKNKAAPNINVAIKITPIYDDARKSDFVREQQLHYLLTQVDTPAVRQRAVKPRETGDFRAKGTEWEKDVVKSLLDGGVFSIVPLYDFVIKRFIIDDVPAVRGYDPLHTVATPAVYASFLVLRRLTGTFESTITDAVTLPEVARRIYYAIKQICAILHLLLPIRFTHGDIHPRNIGVAESSGTNRHYRLTAGRYATVPKEIPHIVLLDFDNCSAFMTDATKTVFDMRPTQESLDRRFGEHVKLTPEQSFSPMVDVFRLVQNMALLLALRISQAGEGDVINLRMEAITQQLARVLEVGTTRLPVSILRSEPYAGLRDFVNLLKSDGGTAAQLKAGASTLARGMAQQQTLWWKLYGETPRTVEETTAMLMPWDVLDAFPAEDRPLSDDSTDMTLYQIYKAGKIYRPDKVETRDAAVIRVDPVNVK